MNRYTQILSFKNLPIAMPTKPDNELSRHRKRMSPEIVKRAKYMRTKKGMTYKQISDDLGFSETSVRRKLVSLGVTLSGSKQHETIN